MTKGIDTSDVSRTVTVNVDEPETATMTTTAKRTSTSRITKSTSLTPSVSEESPRERQTVDLSATTNIYGGAGTLPPGYSPAISTGGIAGTVIGGIVLLAFLAAGGFLLARKKQQAGDRTVATEAAAELDPSEVLHEVEHKDPNVALFELSEGCLPAELASPPNVATAGPGVAIPQA